MLKQEYAIGDYLTNPSCSLDITPFARHQMVRLIEELVFLREYKLETIFIAVSLADRYLVSIAVKKERAPCLITLAVISVLMAAKLEQPIAPSFTRMILVLYDNHKIQLKKKHLINMEEQILRALEFSCHHISPLPFLERFLRIYGIKQDDSGIEKQ